MKIYKVFFVSILAFFTFLLLSSCGDLFGLLGKEEDEPSPEEAPVITEDDFLILAHLDEHPVREEEEVTGIVANFLQTIPSRVGATVIAEEPEAFEVPVTGGFAVKTEGSDTETIPASSALTFYRYTIANEADTNGALIASADKRVGNIIAYIEQDSDDPRTVPFMEMFTTNLTAYICDRIDKYNSVTPEEIEAARQNAVSRSASVASNSGSPSVSVRSYSVAAPNRAIKKIERNVSAPKLVTEWGEGEGYWDVVNAARGTSRHLAGYAAVAMGQLMSYHETPSGCSLSGTFNNPFNAGQSTTFRDITYDWNAMKAVPRVSGMGMSTEGKMGINVLLYEAGQKVNTIYGTDQSRASIEAIPSALSYMGYDISESAVRDYDFKTIKDSIDLQQPVIIGGDAIATTETYTYPITGSGHIWVIDEYALAYRTYPSAVNPDRTVTRIENMVYCRLGWEGAKDGWYSSEMLFDTNGDKYFRFNIRIIPYLKAKDIGAMYR